ncbi:hypothetical protein C8F01DRAFT_1001087, partial [Mycena amicta]
KKTWRSHIYAFYHGDVAIEYRKGQLHHVFTCAARNCKKKIARNQTTMDKHSTQNLRSHAKKCWGEDNILAAEKVQNLNEARRVLRASTGATNQRLTDIFKAHAVNDGETFSHVPLTKEQSRCLRPFCIVKDRAYRFLMKSGRPSTYIPSPSTVARDVNELFTKTRDRIKNHFQARSTNTTGCVSLATDAWTSPNHRAFVAVSGHWEEEGKRHNCLLDFVEVPKACARFFVRRIF